MVKRNQQIAYVDEHCTDENNTHCLVGQTANSSYPCVATEVTCPVNSSSFTSNGVKYCNCNWNYTGNISWNSTTEDWVGDCIPDDFEIS